MHCFPKPFGGMVEEEPAVQQSIRIRRGGAGRDWGCFFQSGRMTERRVRAVFTFPILRRPTIVIQIANTGVICSYPIISRKYDIEDVIHVLIDGDVGVEKDAGVIGGQLESSQFSPGILKTGRYEGSLPVIR